MVVEERERKKLLEEQNNKAGDILGFIKDENDISRPQSAMPSPSYMQRDFRTKGKPFA